MLEIGEDDSRYQRVVGLLKSLGAERFRDSLMTTPTLRDWVAKMVAGGGERLKQEAAMQAQWELGAEVLRQSVELLKSGKKEEARQLLDPAIAEAIQGNHSRWAAILCRHGAVISQSMGDRQRQIHYEEQALPFATDYAFAAYNFAQLLLSDGQLARAEHYAAEAYKRSTAQTADAGRDLITANPYTMAERRSRRVTVEKSPFHSLGSNFNNKLDGCSRMKGERTWVLPGVQLTPKIWVQFRAR